MACNGGGARNGSPSAAQPVQFGADAPGDAYDDDDDDGYGDDDAYDGPAPYGADEEYGGGDAEYWRPDGASFGGGGEDVDESEIGPDDSVSVAYLKEPKRGRGGGGRGGGGAAAVAARRAA